MKYHMWNWLVNIIKRIKNIISNCSLLLNPSLKQRNKFFPLVSNLFSALRIAVTWHPVVTPYTKYFTFSYLFWHSHPLTFSICHVSLHFFSSLGFFFLSFIFVQFLFLFNWSLCRHSRVKVQLFSATCSSCLQCSDPAFILGILLESVQSRPPHRGFLSVLHFWVWHRSEGLTLCKVSLQII